MSTALVIMVFIAAPAVWGQVSVTVSNHTVEVNKPFLVTVEITGKNVHEPTLPTLPGLVIDSRPRRREERFTIGGTNVTEVRMRGYAATVTRVGAIEIPPVTALIDGRLEKSASLRLTVLAGTEEPVLPIQSRKQPVERGPLTIDAAVRTEAEVKQARVFEHAPVELTLDLWIYTGIGVSDSPLYTKYPDATGFYAIPQKPKSIGSETRTRDGRNFRVTRQRQMLYPTAPGTFMIGAWEWTGIAQVRTERGRERHELSRITEPIEVTVIPLPPQPDTFTGAVGSFSFDAELTETTVVQGTPTRLVARITGMGNPDSIGAPSLPDIPDAYVAPPDTDTQQVPNRDPAQATYERSFSYAITPLLAGSLAIPPVEYCYFDPNDSEYHTERAGPFVVRVLDAPEQQPDILVSVADGSGEDILPLTERTGSLHPRRSSLVMPLIILLPPLAYTALVLYLRRRRRFDEDARFVRSYHARTRARRRLRNVLASARPMDELHHALRNFIADKFDVTAPATTSEDARLLFKSEEVDPDVAEGLLLILRKCERARYAGDAPSPDELTALVHGAAAGMDRLESVHKAGVAPASRDGRVES